MRLREYRLSRSLTLRQLAELVGISASSLSRIENGAACGRKSAARIVGFTSGDVGWSDLHLDSGVDLVIDTDRPVESDAA